MCPTTLVKPSRPRDQKGERSTTFTLETTGSWEMVGTQKSGTGTFQLAYNGEPGQPLEIRIIHKVPPDPPPREQPVWSLTGAGEWRLSMTGHGGKTVKELWVGPFTCKIEPTQPVTFIVK